MIEDITRTQVYRFRNRFLAEQFVGHCVKPMRIILGDNDGRRQDGDGEYLVATPADAERLVRAGYEYAECLPLDDDSPPLSMTL